jgi:endoglucanase
MNCSRLASILAACALPVLATTARAGCVDGAALTGVNLAGAEFNSKRLPGKMHKDYTYPDRAELAYFAERGANAIRLPVRWERLQHEPGAELAAPEVAEIAKVVAAAAQAGLCVILDVHNYGTYRGQPIGSEAVPTAAFMDLWLRLAARFRDPAQVALGLMNEPHKLPIAAWADIAGQTLTALRAAGAQHLVLVSGGRWSGIHEWRKTFSGTSNATALAELRDPLGRMAIEVHQYADKDFSGTGKRCHPPERFDNMFRMIGEWARDHQQRLFLGEFGVPAEDGCLAVLDHMLELAADRQVWLGWTYWAAGRWWGDYPLSVSPKDGTDAAQMGVLTKYLGR